MSIPKVLEHLVFERPDFATNGFCQNIIDRAQGSGFHPATVTSEQGPAFMPDIRNNDRVIFDDPDFADNLWQMARPLFPEPFKGDKAVGLNERLRIYRYSAGQYFDWHQDGEFKNNEGLISKFTMMIYLNDGFEGGGTSFADIFSSYNFRDFIVEPAIGKALFFHHQLSHRGDTIISGEKFVLRTDVMFHSKEKIQA